MEWLVCAVGRRCLWDVGWREWSTLVDRCGLFFTVSSGCSVVKGQGWGRGHKKSRSNCDMIRWEKARKGEGLLEIRESRVIHWFPKKLSLGGGVSVCVCLEIRGHCWVSFCLCTFCFETVFLNLEFKASQGYLLPHPHRFFFFYSIWSLTIGSQVDS